jgi:phage host-nuclease inhibitor protein Gam
VLKSAADIDVGLPETTTSGIRFVYVTLGSVQHLHAVKQRIDELLATELTERHARVLEQRRNEYAFLSNNLDSPVESTEALSEIEESGTELSEFGESETTAGTCILQSRRRSHSCNIRDVRGFEKDPSD